MRKTPDLFWRCMTCKKLLFTLAGAQRHADQHEHVNEHGQVYGHGARLECWTKQGRLSS